ncbi:MAG: hypothetical protein DELT_02682 [Desulfovibrio sp.]
MTHTPRVYGKRHGSQGLFRQGLAGLILAAVVLAFLSPRAALAVPPKYFTVENPRLEMQDGNITVKLGIGVDNPIGLFEMLKDGASVELVVNAKLERVRTLWTNVAVAELELLSSLQHNPLTREFSLYMPGVEKPLLDKNLDRLITATWQKFEVPFGPVSILNGEEKDSEYRITLTLRLQHAKPPPWLAKSFMIWSKDILDPEKVVIGFRH